MCVRVLKAGFSLPAYSLFVLIACARLRLLKAAFPVGCQQKFNPEGDLTPRICPVCHNGPCDSL
jgi:hypothetical protein